MSTPAVLVAVEEGGTDNPVLLPAIYDIIWSSVAFAILFFLFWRFVLPQMRQALEARTEGIERKLEQAERDRAEAQQLLADYRQQLQEARSEASRIRTEAQSERASIVEAARVEAQQEAERVGERSRAQLQADIAQVRADLSREVGRLAVDLAGRVVGENLADTDRTRRTVDRFLDDLDGADAQRVASGDGSVRGR